MSKTADGKQDSRESYGSDPTTQTTKLEILDAGGVFERELWNAYSAGKKDGPFRSSSKPIVEGKEYLLKYLNARIQSEASRIALEAIGEDDAPDVRIEEINGIEGEYDWSSPCNQLRAEQRTKLKALTAPEGGNDHE